MIMAINPQLFPVLLKNGYMLHWIIDKICKMDIYLADLRLLFI